MNDTLVADERVNFDRPEGNDDDNPPILWLVQDEGEDDGEENESISCDGISICAEKNSLDVRHSPSTVGQRCLPDEIV